MLKSLDGALALLTRFTLENPCWGVRELARETGIHHAVVQRVLATFASNGFLMQDGAGRYSLGLRLFELGQVAHRNFVPSVVVQPALDSLAKVCGETVFLMLLDGIEGVCTDTAQSQQQLRFSIEPGKRFSLVAGAHAKAILAFQTDEFRSSVYLDAGVADSTLIESNLEKIRMDGWSYTREESAATVAGIAIPLRSPIKGHVFGSLAVAGPFQRINDDAAPKLVEALKRTREVIEPVVGLSR
jgi:IclR family acetate operon transcriptional repressor